jgi:hypothetical protein
MAWRDKTRQKSEPLAGVGVTHRRYEKAEAEGHHEDVQHELLLCDISGATPMAFSCWCRGATRRIGFRGGGRRNVIGIS